VGTPPVALIVDSPWMPGFHGVSQLDYYLDPELWFASNLRLAEEFPEVIFLPSWWVEYGMAIEPSTVGARVLYHPDQPPSVVPLLASLSEVSRLPDVHPWRDGLMALALHRIKVSKPRICDAGQIVPIITARGPLCLASFLRGITELMVDLVEDPDGVHRLLQYSTETVIRFLHAQAEALGDEVRGVFLLDDIPGMLSRRAYLEFAHPYLKQIFDTFGTGCVRIYHNDANVRPFLADLPSAGIDVLNWSHMIPVAEAFEKTGSQITLMGNVAPLELGVNGTQEQVQQSARQVIEDAAGRRLILSLGGGVSPGMPAGNIRALAACSGSVL
jgi:uroporphyrinogen-III decarboxylase